MDSNWFSNLIYFFDWRQQNMLVNPLLVIINYAFILIDECVELNPSVSVLDLSNPTGWLPRILKAPKDLSRAINKLHTIHSCVICRTINNKQIIISVRLIIVSWFHFPQL
jgi:hypothetical protein